ncbi:hypothetical protein ABK040_009587 [Willaertia magna]
MLKFKPSNFLRLFNSPPTCATSFYKRQLADHLIPFSSEKGKELFRSSLENRELENYFSLAEQFHTQQEPAFCGLGSLSMVLNSLQCDPNQVWKGVWRYYDENLLTNCCVTKEQVLKKGLQMEQFWCLGVCSGLDIQLFRNSTIEQFRQHVIECCKYQKHHLVINFSRRVLSQTGDGHFSPIGGYNSKEDMVLLLDVARFKYPSYWVSLELLYESMIQIDKTTNNKRGYFTLKPSENASSRFYKLFKSNALMSWRRFCLFLLNDFLPLKRQKLMSATNLSEYLNILITDFEILKNQKPIEYKCDFLFKKEDQIHPSDLEPTTKVVCDILFSFCDTLLNELATCAQHKDEFFTLMDDMKKLDLYKIVKKHIDEYQNQILFYKTPKLDIILTLLLYTIPHRKLPMNENLKRYLVSEHRNFELIPNISSNLSNELRKLSGGVKILCDICEKNKDDLFLNVQSQQQVKQQQVNDSVNNNTCTSTTEQCSHSIDHSHTTSCKLYSWGKQLRWSPCVSQKQKLS